MDLFTLVAKLTLDPKEYEKEVKKAERKASSAKIDVSGTISANDTYTAKLHLAENAAKGFDAHAEGTISADDKFSGAMDTAKTNADNFDAEAQGTISADDQFSGSMDTAEQRATDAELDADGTLTADDQFSGDLQTAEDNAEGADLDAEGTATLDDDYSTDLSDLESDAADADLDAEGTATLDDDYSTDLDDLETDASTADLDVAGTATLDHTDFDTSITDMKESVNGLDGLLKGLKVAGITAGISKAASWAYGVIDDTVQYADRVDKTSRQIGLSFEAFQEWDHALSQSGASIEATKRGIMNMNAAMTGTASEDVSSAYSAIGIDATSYSSQEDLFRDTIMKLAGMEAGAERDNLVTGIFGRNGMELNALLDSGPQEIQALIDEAHELGLVMSDADIQKNVELGDDIANLKASVQSLLMSVVSDVAPALVSIVNFVTDILTTLRRVFGGGDSDKSPHHEAVADQITQEGVNVNGVRYWMQDGRWVYEDSAVSTGPAQGFKNGYGTDRHMVEGNASGGMVRPVTDPATLEYLARYAANVAQVTAAGQYTGGYLPFPAGTGTPQISAGNASVSSNAVSVNGDTVIVSGGEGADSSNAKGLWSVPYDDYSALLHRDEMVLTASQARDYREGRFGGSEDVVAAIERLGNEMQNLKIMVGEKVFGQTVVDYSGRRMRNYIGQADSRAYAGYGWG